MSQAHHHPSPDYLVTLDGRDITPLMQPRLIELTITDNPGFEADQLDIVLDDSDGALAMPARGVVVNVAIGWRGDALIDKGTYNVDEVEHSGAPDRLTIRARSADLRGRFHDKRNQSWHGTMLGAVISSIAARNNLVPVIAQALADRAIAHLDQTDESDANMLTRLARMHDSIATVKDRRLLLMPNGAGTTAGGTPLQPVTITRSSGDQHRFAAADRDAYTGVLAYWHNTRTGQRESFLAGSENAPAGDDTTEPGAGSVKTLRHTYASLRNAREAAEAEWKRLQRAVAEFSLTLAIGQPELIPELPTHVVGFRPEIDSADWIIKRLTHRLTPDSLTTAAEFQIRTSD
ncbi:phage late control D family protein [Thauera butanivorans]|uniref:phage late control D family protein n=1 Tax=Thauera butanivorans TaxID=86174 RepID=UPI0008393175|nr:phage late control D family protein [Thauera butanivorans]